MRYKLGRTRRRFDNRIPHFSHLKFLGALVSIPAYVDNTIKMNPDCGLMLNDSLGDCTCAAFYHAVQVWSACATPSELTEPDACVLQMYEEATGYNPGDAPTDQGADEQSILKYLLNTGAPMNNEQRNKIQAFVEIDPTNIPDVQRAIYECGVAYIGINLPNSVMNNANDATKPWDVGGDESIAGGHAVVLVGYDTDANLFKLISWGTMYHATEAFILKFCEEAYGMADATWIKSTGLTSAGLSLDALDALMQSIKEVS